MSDKNEISGVGRTVAGGELLKLPPDHPHAVKAIKRSSIMLEA